MMQFIPTPAVGAASLDTVIVVADVALTYKWTAPERDVVARKST